MTWPPNGTRVRIADGSEAHGDIGTVWLSQPGLCLIELDDNCCIWPVSEEWEIKVVEPNEEGE